MSSKWSQDKNKISSLRLIFMQTRLNKQEYPAKTTKSQINPSPSQIQNELA